MYRGISGKKYKYTNTIKEYCLRKPIQTYGNENCFKALYLNEIKKESNIIFGRIIFDIFNKNKNKSKLCRSDCAIAQTTQCVINLGK